MKANHIYRVIWSEVLASWVAVSEITRARGKAGRGALCLALGLLAINVQADGVPTTVVPTGGQTSAYLSANGTPVVNINAANTAGLSHNRYTRYDVDNHGLVLNNGNASQIQRASRLAGSVLANPNLNKEANVILNEVVSTKRSTLAGFTEVVGGKADVVVANPHGITCSGCGFINTDRATLTTGTPQLNAGGGLDGFNVERGDVLVEGDGLNASGQKILDLVARSIRVDGRINVSPTGSLQVVTGANTWNYGTREVTGTLAGSGPAPAYAIDSTALGGMYADRIRLIGTEAGVGVRMLGEAAATADDFRLTSAGNVVVQSQVSAQRHIDVATTGGGAGVSLVDADASLSAGGDLSVATAAAKGGSIDNQGLLLSGGTLTVAADQSIVNGVDGAMSAPRGGLTLTACTGDLTNAGWLYSGTGVSAHADQGTFTNTAYIWSAGDMALGADILVNSHSMQAVNDILINTTTGFRNGRMPAKTTSEAVTAQDLSYHTLKEGATCWYCSYIRVREDTLTVTEHWDGGTPNLTLPEVAAGHDLSIHLNTGTGKNTGGVLTAGNDLAINGSGPATFDNTAIARYARQYKRRWAEHEDDCISCTVRFFYYYADNGAHFNQMPTWNGIDGFVFPWETLWDPGFEHMYGHVRYSSGGPSAAMDNEVRQKAYRHLVGTTVVENLQNARLHGNTVTFKGLALANDGPAVAPAPYDPDTPPTPTPLPTNPNGYFVPARNASAHYLIETNPRYGLGSDYAGTDRLLKSLGLDPETTEKRLGDANYEAYLIRQQLISQTGAAVLDGYANEAKQMASLMDQAAGESKRLGLTLGQPLTSEQMADLSQDIVWMVETTVAGQKVLQPVVYLSPESRQAIIAGAVIAGREVNMDVTSLGNTGGTLSGGDALNVTSRGNITNISGTIQGGEVSLKSTEGGIVHGRAQGLGAESDYKAAGIEATGNLTLDAAKDIGIRAAEVKAGGAAALTAGGDITADTLVDTRSSGSTTAGSADFLYQTGPASTFTLTERNVGSTLSTGGGLSLKSGGDTTLAGTKAQVGGDLKVDTGGDFNILSRQDRTTTHTTTSTSGFGVGGGLWGSEYTTVEDVVGKNFGSSVSVGGNADITAGKDMTLRGSDLTIGGSGKIDADSVKIEQGLDEQHTLTRTVTSTFLSTGGQDESHSAAASGSGSGQAAAQAEAGAGTGASESHAFNLMESRTTEVRRDKTTGVASSLSTGGDLTIKARDEAKVVGSSVETGGDLGVEARKITVEAGQNTDSITTTVHSTKIGVYTDSKAEASAEAEASATGMSATVKAEAGVKAEAESTVTIGARLEDSVDTTTAVTHTQATLKSGKDMTLKAQDQARFVGAQVESGGNLDIQAKDITSLAAEDKTTTSHDKTTQTMGVYLEGKASAEAEGALKAGPANASAKGSMSVEAEVGAGLRYSDENKLSGAETTHNVVNTFKAGGNINRTATGTITDQGTQLEAGKDITQSATTLREIAAHDKTSSHSSTETHDVRVGVYAGAGYSADVGAQTGALGHGAYAEDLGGEASAGLEAQYTYEKTGRSSSTSTAVTSRYKAGGSITSTTKDKTTLIGTRMEAGGEVTLKAGSLDYQAAQDSSSTSTEDRSASAGGKAKLVGTQGVAVEGGYEQGKTSSTSSTARAGGIGAGGNVTIITQGDARLEGTEVAAGNKAAIKSETGGVTLDAASSTTHEQSSGFGIHAEFGSTKSGGERESKSVLGGGHASGKSDTTTQSGARIQGSQVEISAGKDATLRGSQVEAMQNASVTAGGKVELLESVNSESGSSFGISGKATGMKLEKPDGTKTSSQYGGANVNVSDEERKTGTATRIQAGSGLTVKGGGITSQGADLQVGGAVKLEGNVTETQLTDVDKGMKIDLNVDGLRKNAPKAK